MKRVIALAVTVLFVSILGVLTGLDIVQHGLGLLDVISILVLGVLGTGIIGALLHRPGNPPP